MKCRLATAAALIAMLAGTVFAETQAERIIRESGVKGGLCVHIGVTDGQLTADLRADGKFVVHGLALDENAAKKARELIRKRGLYGKVSVDTREDLSTLPYADDLANLVVVGDLDAMRAKGLAQEEVYRVVAPRGAMVYGRAGGLAVSVKERPGRLDEWTHMRHGADGNVVSRDEVVGVPERIKWMAEPTWARSHAINGCNRGMVSTGGRFFYVYDAAPRGTYGPMRMEIVARDAFNGVQLWGRPIESTTPLGVSKEIRQKYWDGGYYWYKRRSLAARGDRVYTVLKQDGPLCALDAATGETVRTYDAVGTPEEVMLLGDRLVTVQSREKGRGYGPVCCADIETGKLLWKHDADNGRYVMSDGKSVFFDTGKEVVSLKASDGSLNWRAKKPDGAIALCFVKDGRLVLKGRSMNAYALSAADGEPLWTYHYRDFNGYSYTDTDIYAVGGRIWVQVRGEKTWSMVGLDPETGKETKRIGFPETYPKTRGHHRCHPNKATERFFILDTAGLDFIDREKGSIVDLRPFRGNCYVGILPANGLIYIPPNACQCGEYLRGFVATAPAREKTPLPEAPWQKRLVRGPAWSDEKGKPSEADDWTTYRHDARRSGATDAEVPAEVQTLWEKKIGPGLTAPVVADGTIYLALSDVHEVRALDAATGDLKWRFTAGGRVDSPPTVYNGRVLFGCRDGWVYCLRVADGELAWKFRAAPRERLVVAFEQLESAWPLFGSVLVHDGVAFFSAGRFSELDGGIRAYAADPATGKILWESTTPQCLDEMLKGRVWETHYPPVALNDILMGRGDFVSMRITGFNVKTGEIKQPKYVWWSRSGMLDENSWVGRMRWRGPRMNAELLVFDRDTTYGILIPDGYDRALNPGKSEYQLCAKGAHEWSEQVPLRARAMVIAGDVLFVAGFPDVVVDDDYWAAMEGRKGAALWSVSKNDGKTLAQVKLAGPPVFDGMAASAGRLYITTMDGKLLCLGKR